MSDKERPHPDNVPGAFYVVDGCCTSCGVPVDVAPDVFAWNKESHCFVKRQPETDAETTRALKAISGAELPCIRYRGTDRAVLERLAGLGQPELADVTPHLAPVLRNHATFDVASGEPSSALLATRFRDHLLADSRSWQRYTIRPVATFLKSARLTYGWAMPQFHRVVFRDLGLTQQRWLVSHRTYLAVSDHVNDWLTTDPLVTNVRWYSQESWKGNREWRSTPW